MKNVIIKIIKTHTDDLIDKLQGYVQYKMYTLYTQHPIIWSNFFSFMKVLPGRGSWYTIHYVFATI